MKEGKSRRRAAFWLLGIGGVLITAAIIALYTPWLPIFDLREIAVSGNRRTSAQEIAQATGLRRGAPLPKISLRDIRDRVSSLPWVKAVDLRRDFFHTLSIRITEREPVARAYRPDGACALLAEGGVMVAPACDPEWGGLIRLDGAVFTGGEAGATLVEPQVGALVETIRSASWAGAHVQGVDVSDGDAVELKSDTGIRILLGPLRTSLDRVNALESLCRELDPEGYELIDLRFGGEATLVPRVRR